MSGHPAHGDAYAALPGEDRAAGPGKPRGAASRRDAEAALAALWTPGARDEEGFYVLRFGYLVPRSRMYDACQSLAGVTRVEVTSPASDPTFTAVQFAALAATPAVTVIQETT